MNQSPSQTQSREELKQLEPTVKFCFLRRVHLTKGCLGPTYEDIKSKKTSETINLYGWKFNLFCYLLVDEAVLGAHWLVNGGYNPN